MGVYLPKPRTSKESEDGGHSDETFTRFGLSAMQGWRQYMEDAHLADTAFEGHNIQQAGLFGVFDGHGGPAVSAWVSSAFHEILRAELTKAAQNLKAKSLIPKIDGLDEQVVMVCEALQQSFLSLDETMKTAPNRDQIKVLHEEAEKLKKRLREEEGGAEPESLLEAIIAGVGGNRPVVRIIEQDGQKFYQLISQDGPPGEEEEEEKNESRVEDLGDEETKNDGVELTVGLDRTASRRGEEVEKLLQQVEQEIEEDKPNGNLDQGMSDNADSKAVDVDALTAEAMHPSQPEYCGTTAIVTMVLNVTPPVLVTANAGDSRAVLCRAGVAIPLSQDHKPGLKRETDRILKAGGRVVNGRVDGNLNLSRSVGDLFYKSDQGISAEEQKITAYPDVRVTAIAPEDEFVIVACDGIWDCLTNQEAVDLVSVKLAEFEGDDQRLSKVCEKICDQCLSTNPLESEGGVGCDNMTIMIVQLNQHLLRNATPATDKPVIFYGEEPDMTTLSS